MHSMMRNGRKRDGEQQPQLQLQLLLLLMMMVMIKQKEKEAKQKADTANCFESVSMKILDCERRKLLFFNLI